MQLDLADPQRFCVVWTTVASQQQAQELARLAVESQMVACAQIEPIQSHYRWNGQMCNEAEWRIAMKSRMDRYGALEAWIRQRHPYENPEIIAMPIVRGAAAYLAWMSAAMAPDKSN